MAVKKASAAKAVKSKKSATNEAIIKEAVSIGMIAASIFLILGIFTANSAGAIGSLIGGFLTGLLGIGAYILPFIIITISIYVLFDKKKTIPLSKTVMGILLFLLFISFAHIVSFDDSKSYADVIDYITDNYKTASALNGGLIGALFGNFLLKLLGTLGAYILIVSLSIALVMLLTGRSFFEAVTGGVSRVKEALLRDDEVYEDIEYYDEIGPDGFPAHPEPDKCRECKKRQAEIYDFEAGKRKKEKKTKILLPFEKDSAQAKSALEIDFDGKEPEDGHVVPFHEGAAQDEKPEAPLPDMDIETAAPDSEEAAGIKMMGLGFDEPVKKEPVPDKPVLKESPLEDKSSAVAPVDMNEAEPKPKEYRFPPVDLLAKNPEAGNSASREKILKNSKKLEDTLASFGVKATVIEVSIGPTVTRYELSPGQGVKVSKILNLADDLALNLAASGIRIEAPIPGKSAVGIEVPNKETQSVYFREVIEDEAFKKFPSKLAFGLGKDIGGKTVVWDIGKMPHMLIAGATGAGKSVCISTIVNSIIFKATPDEVKLIMVDPKVVELKMYSGIPHLMIPVVTDPKKAAGALNWAVKEMLHRYELFAANAVRDLEGYNVYARENGDKPLPQIVIIIDELADLMMAAPGEVEDAICRLAQMARAAGIHLIIATQRPSVDVITGVIKANIPSRLAFRVSSGIDSRTILDMVGAEKLIGKGDMLFYPIGMNKPLRIQGAFISDKEVENIVEFLKQDAPAEYDEAIEKEITSATKFTSTDEETDEFFEPAVDFVIQKEKASASMLQRQFRIGYNRASRLIEDLQNKGIVGPEDGAKPRKVLVTSFQWQEMKNGAAAESSDGLPPVPEMKKEDSGA